VQKLFIPFSFFLLASACGPGAIKQVETTAEYPNKLTYTEKWRQKEKFRFLVLGDTQNPKPGHRQNQEQRIAIFAAMKTALSEDAVSADFVVHTGDFVETGSDEEHWRKYFDDIFWNDLDDRQKQQFFPALGNHEYKPHFLGFIGSCDLKPYFKRFQHIRERRFYYFYYGNSCFIVLDSGKNGFQKLFGETWESGVSQQLDWLESTVFPDLKSSQEIENILVFWHKAAFATPRFLRNKKSSNVLARFEDFNIRLNHRFTIVSFTGHIHTFAHIQQDYNGDGKHTIHNFTCGCGGGSQRGREYYKKVKKPENLDLYRQSRYEMLAGNGVFEQAAFDSVRYDNDIFGFVEVTIDRQIEVKFNRFAPEEDRFFSEYEYLVQ
jgi:hypothetical protein